jgi:UDP-N-acetylmuramate dehydrogenase
LKTQVPLAPWTTFELGGPARYFVQTPDEPSLVRALQWAAAEGLEASVLGGGSNLVVADRGYEGLVIQLPGRGVQSWREGERVHLRVQAGEPWDPLVEWSVEQGLAGLECLSGIPGLAGATPIQNVGAYGQEVSETITAVRVLDRRTLQVQQMAPEDCLFAYRDSVFKRNLGRWVVLSVDFALRPGGEPSVRYAELERALQGRTRGGADALTEVRRVVLQLRRGKSMVLAPDDPNRRSAGSFFTNPILPEDEARRVIERAVEQGLATDPSGVPAFDAGPGRTKLAAGWLIERSGIRKGLKWGPVGVSSRHALALVHHGGGRTEDLLSLARHVQRTVRDRFGVTLRPEPVMLGFHQPPL